MSFQAMTWATEQELPAMQKIVLLMMANRTNHDTGLCFPSHDTLAKECGMAKRSLINQIDTLAKQELLTVIHTFGEDGRKRNNHYRLHLDKTTKKQPTPVKVDVQQMHYPSAGDAHTLVQELHVPSAGDAHKPVIITSNIKPVIKPREDAPQKPEILAEEKPAKAEKAKPEKKWNWETDFDFAFALAYLISKNRVSKDSNVDGISMDLWHEWMKSRKSNKAKMTETSLTTCLQDLIEINEAGLDANEAMREAIKREWIGLGHWIEKMKLKPSRAVNSGKPNRDFANPPKYSLNDDFGDSSAIDSFAVPVFQIGGAQ